MMRPSGTSGTTPFTTNRLRPTGGVIKAISMLIIKITPNQTLSQPNVSMMGMMMGVVITMIDKVSSKHPGNSRSRLMAMKTSHCGKSTRAITRDSVGAMSVVVSA